MQVYATSITGYAADAYGLQAATLQALLPEWAVSILERRCSGKRLEALGPLSSPDQAARCLSSRSTSRLARSSTTTREQERD